MEESHARHAEEEHFFSCPCCWQRVSVLIDLSAGAQEFVEDCEVCCRPLTIRYSIENGAIARFEALNVV